MTDRIVGISLEWDGWIVSPHPTVEDIVEKQIREHGTYHCPLRSSSASCNQGAVRHAYRCLQPSFQIKKYHLQLVCRRTASIKRLQSISSKKLWMSRSSTQS